MAERIGINEIIRTVAEDQRLTIQESTGVVRQVFEIIRQSMIHDVSVHIPCFGVFRGVMKPAGMVVNPKTGVKLYREGHRVPRIKFSYTVLRVDEKAASTETP